MDTPMTDATPEMIEVAKTAPFGNVWGTLTTAFPDATSDQKREAAHAAYTNPA